MNNEVNGYALFQIAWLWVGRDGHRKFMDSREGRAVRSR